MVDDVVVDIALVVLGLGEDAVALLEQPHHPAAHRAGDVGRDVDEHARLDVVAVGMVHQPLREHGHVRPLMGGGLAFDDVGQRHVDVGRIPHQHVPSHVSPLCGG
jgi:hypothetical protein